MEVPKSPNLDHFSLETSGFGVPLKPPFGFSRVPEMCVCVCVFHTCAFYAAGGMPDGHRDTQWMVFMENPSKNRIARATPIFGDLHVFSRTFSSQLGDAAE